MSGKATELACCAAGYAVGSVPVGLWLGKLARGVDVRDYGSGGTGTTNVLRTVGPAAAGAVFILDVAKGSVAVGLARQLGASPTGQAAAGLGAVIGHSWPLFARFRGGKSVATAFGALLLLTPEGSACAVGGGLTALAATRTVSVGSLAAAGSATLCSAAMAMRGGEQRRAGLLFAVSATALIAWRHSANLRRLARGEEPRVSLRRRSPVATAPPL
jgi:glycerol-3-phosphate acyltransferase PlsY